MEPEGKLSRALKPEAVRFGVSAPQATNSLDVHSKKCAIEFLRCGAPVARHPRPEAMKAVLADPRYLRKDEASLKIELNTLRKDAAYFAKESS